MNAKALDKFDNNNKLPGNRSRLVIAAQMTISPFRPIEQRLVVHGIQFEA